MPFLGHLVSANIIHDVSVLISEIFIPPVLSGFIFAIDQPTGIITHRQAAVVKVDYGRVEHNPCYYSNHYELEEEPYRSPPPNLPPGREEIYE